MGGRGRRLPWLAVLLVALLGLPSVGDGAGGGQVAATTAGQADPPDGTGAGPTGVLPPGQRWTVTLLTGHVVDVSSDAEGRVTASVRRSDGGYQALSHPDGRLYVIPNAVTGMLADQLDPELFNVTGLVQQGYDDASRDSIGVIVQRDRGADVPEILASPAEQTLPSIDAVALDVPKAEAVAADEQLFGASSAGAADPLAGVTKVWLDRRMTAASTGTSPTVAAEAVSLGTAHPAIAPAGTPSQTGPAELDPNLTQIGADRAWDAGLTGEGVSVAVLDTGIDRDHPDLANEVVAEQNFSDSDTADDRHGHGTHVAATAAGSGAGAAGARSGVAPDADLVNGKVLDDYGYGWESDIVAGMEWAAPQADVVNMSLGGPPPDDPQDDPMAQAVDRLTEQHGTLFVVAAGNSGPASTRVDSPGVAAAALTVGAVDGEDQLADFSSRGPVPGTYAMKPEVVAPGVDVVAARARGTRLGDPVSPDYTSLSGTSMATPHVAGAAAILVEQHPAWDADELKTALVGSTDAVEGDGYDVGGGRLDVGAAIDSPVLAERSAVQVSLPHPRTEPHQETLTWTNTGDEAQTLELTADLHDRSGTGQDAVSIEPAQLTIAPGETGSATVTVDGPALESGLYSGTVTATSVEDDQFAVRTPLAVHAVPEQAELTVEATPPVEAPSGALGTPTGIAAVVNLDDAAEFLEFVYYEGEGFTVTVPVGRYSVVGYISSGDLDMDVEAQVGDPDVSITGDTTVAFDGRAAEPLDPTVEGVDTYPPLHSSSALASTPRLGTDGHPVVMESFAVYPDPPVRLTPMQADPEVFSASQLFRLQEPHLTAQVAGEPLDIIGVPGYEPSAGEHVLTAFDAGDGSDFTGAAGRLAVVRLPTDLMARPAIAQRAVDAGVALLAFVDEQRPHLALFPFGFPSPEELKLITAAGSGATDLLVAAAAGDEVTVRVTGSPYVYDILTPASNEVEPNPVIDEAEQAQLATLHERFHRDVDGPEPTGDARYLMPDPDAIVYGDFPISPAVYSEGPLPEEWTAYVSPDVEWTNNVNGHGRIFGTPESNLLLSSTARRRFEPGEERTVSWLRRPQWPGPVGGPLGQSGCQPLPVARDLETLLVWLAPFQDGLDRYGCSEPETASLTLERDGQVVGRAESYFAEFEVPQEPGRYTLTYEQEGASPYPHRSHTSWTFGSSAPDEPGSDEPIPLVVVDYRLPLDTLNRPTDNTARISVQHVTGSRRGLVLPPHVWTSTDGGEHWQRARVRWGGGATYRVGLPEVQTGTSVSLRVEAHDLAGNGIDQILYDAYTG